MKNKQQYKSLILSICFLLLFGSSFGQNNLSSFYDNQHDVNAARLFASELDLGSKHVQIGFDYYLWVGNNTFNYGSIQDINSKKSISDDQVNSILENIKDDNILGFGQDIQVLAIAFQFKTKQLRRPIVFSLSVDDKVASNLVLSQNLAKLFWKGNAQFAGETVHLDPFAINVNYIREYVLGSAFTLFGSQHHKELRLGVRAKYIQGIGSLYMTNKDFTFYTQSSGDTLDVGFDYNIKTSRANENFNIFKPAGGGAGFDLSLSYYPSPNFTFGASITDVNFVTFNQDVTSYAKSGHEIYTGATISNLFGGDIQFNPDQITDVFIPKKTTGGSYQIPVSPRLNLLAEYQQIVTDTVKGNFPRNSIFLNYIQGFSNLPGTTVNPFIAAGYTHGFGRTLNLGISTAYGGYNRFVFGPYFSLYWSRKRISFGSDNLGGLLFTHMATGTDLTIHFTASF